ncbi:MAG: hypothetical protein NTW50_04595 [Candidatus Berkelbacteria bacterium]|nr:hypothetical protein [Candidatus Berkelbacteria bacterium]
MKFHDQLESARRRLFGNSGEPPDQLESARRLIAMTLPKAVPCHKDENGEWIPDQPLETIE